MNKLLIVLLLLPILSIGVFAEGVYQYSTTVDLGDTAKYETSIILVDYTKSVFTFSILGSPRNIELNSSSFGDSVISMGCTQQDTTWGKEVKCNIPSSYQKTIITMKYEFDNKISKKNNYLVYSDTITLPETVGKFVMSVRLPEGYGLINKNDAFAPDGALIGSDGRRSFLYWTNEGTVENYKFDTSIAYEEVTSFDYGILEIILLVIITAVIIIVVALKYFSKQKSIQVILPVLKQDEKKIFESLMKHEPGVKQKLIVIDSGYSKAKVSKVLKSLNERGLVKLERIGRTNKVYYDEKFKKGKDELKN